MKFNAFIKAIRPYGGWLPPKFLLVMKLTTIMIVFALVQVNAKSFSQKITLNEKNAPLEKVLSDLKKQSNYEFFYDDKDVNQNVTINIKDVSIDDALNAILKNTSLTFNISEKTVFLKRKEPTFFEKLKNTIQAIDVAGRVIDEKGEPIAGATIQLKDGSQATATDAQGNFAFKGVDPKAVIIITVVGFEKKELPVTANMGEIQLKIALSKLDEVKINAGYYTVTDRERTGSISKVTAESIGEQPVNNSLMALVGRVPGLQITQQTGIPGSAFTVQIRGRNSINSGNDPLYIIDGVIYPSTRISGGNTSTILGSTGTGASSLSLINPGDIESIEVLKDADATAIYGSRGANGVILITTKKGKPGNNKVTASVSQGFSQVAHRVNLLNTDQYIAMRKEAFKNDGLTPTATDYDVNGTWDSNKYTNWQKELIGGNAPNTNASVSVSGGSEKSNYLLSGNYYHEGTVFPGNFGFKRASFLSSINLGSASDRLNASFTVTYNHTESNQPGADPTLNIFMPPNLPDPYDQYGKLTWSNNSVYLNPMAQLLQTNYAGTDNLVGNLTFSYRILKGLVFKTSLGYTEIKRDELQETPLAIYNPSLGATSTNRVSLFGNNYNNSLIVEPIITYHSKLGPGNLDALAGMTVQSNNYQITTIQGSGFNSDDLMDVIGSAALVTTNQNLFSQYRYTAAYARLNYNLSGKYILNLTGRRDGSSRFGADRQFANFGAAGAAWIFSDEKFIQESLPFLSFGKLRASYGITGNDQIGDYGYLQLYNNGGTYQGVSTLTPSTAAANANFGWETNRKIEAAIQLGFLKDKINLEVAFYRNRSSNQLLFQTLPLSTGLGGVNGNLPGEVQNTGLELNGNFKIITKKDWKWTTSLNLTIPNNKLLAYPGLETSSNSTVYRVGQPLSILEAYNVTVSPQTGLYVIEDKNNSGTVDNDDRYLTEFIGQRYYGGWQNSVKYKQFTLDFNFSFAKQSSMSYMTVESRTPGGWLTSNQVVNQFSDVLSRWQQPGDQSLVQKFTTISANNTLNTNVKSMSNLSVVDASYIRLRNVSLGYSLPKKWLSVFNISNGTINIQGENIFTLTKYIGLDPETTQGLHLPPLRIITMGLNLTF
jgi:TonB-linked SusC/RagA family outer membrane protein